MKQSSFFGVALVLLLLANGACSRSAEPPQAPSSSQAIQAEYLLNEGLKLAREGKHLKAEQYLLAAWDAGLPPERVVGPLVESCVTTGRLRSALFHVQRARRERPQDPSLVHLMATLHLGLGQPELAAQAVDDLGKAEPTYPEALYFLGEYHYGRKQAALARVYLQRFVELFPDAPQVPWARHLLTQLAEFEELDEPIELSSNSKSGGAQ